MKIEEVIPHLRNNEAVNICFRARTPEDEGLYMNTRVWSGSIDELLDMEFELRPKNWLDRLPHEEEPISMIETLEKIHYSELKLKAL